MYDNTGLILEENVPTSGCLFPSPTCSDMAPIGFHRRRIRRPPPLLGISIVGINVHDGKGFGIAQVVQVVELGVFNLMVLTKTKISTVFYCRNRLGYDIVLSPAQPTSNGEAQGGVGLVLWDWSTGWSPELTRLHGLNVVNCEVITGTSWTSIVGAYLPPTTLGHPPDLVEALKLFQG